MNTSNIFELGVGIAPLRQVVEQAFTQVRTSDLLKEKIDEP
ncbi:MAG: hypothetical protein V3V10_00445 [Planctomycetota bacterium]